MGKLKKSFEFWYLVSVAVGLAIATSSFMMLSKLSMIAKGLTACITILFSGLFCLVIAKCVSELAKKNRGSIGIRGYLKISLGNQVSLILVYLYVIFLILIAGIESYVFSVVVINIFPEISTLSISISLLAIVLIMNLQGFDLPRILQMAITSILVIGIMFIGIYGFTNSDVKLDIIAKSGEFLSETSILYFVAAIGLGFFLFVGFEWVGPVAFSPNSFVSIVPASMYCAIIINIVMNIIFIIGMTFSSIPEKFQETLIPQVHLCRELFGKYGGIVALGMSLLAILSTFNAGMQGGSRLIYSLASENNFFRFGKVVSNSGVPWGAILFISFCSLISSLLILNFHLEMYAAVISSAIVCFVYSALIFAFIKINDFSGSFIKRILIQPLFYCSGVILFLIGFLSLFSEEKSKVIPLIFLIFATIASILLSLYFKSLNKARVPLSRAQK